MTEEGKMEKKEGVEEMMGDNKGKNRKGEGRGEEKGRGTIRGE